MDTQLVADVSMGALQIRYNITVQLITLCCGRLCWAHIPAAQEGGHGCRFRVK
ncbi:hypothetical protein PVAP13_9NG312000 [Panicum virgatum]|uniref:Uncharacterized protein n=1 Tax=Panicum virgatum TaxID=38727 RepID=A0A8T0ML84_PANVG|nr:hypothetical protein PVAP13_9NG312000 [Panicum virgatum]